MSYRTKKLVELAVDLVRQHPRLTAAEASDRLQVHRHTLQRALKANGLSFGLIKQALVLEHLDGRLALRATSLKQVWTELGFTSASAFARYIRHATGKSPSELTRRLNLGPFGTQKAQNEPRRAKGGE
jgi:AraC-like DNA-binding protein